MTHLAQAFSLGLLCRLLELMKSREGLHSSRTDHKQVWSLTQLHSVDFSKSRIGVKKVCLQQMHNQGWRQLLLTVCPGTSPAL